MGIRTVYQMQCDRCGTVLLGSDGWDVVCCLPSYVDELKMLAKRSGWVQDGDEWLCPKHKEADDADAG